MKKVILLITVLLLSGGCKKESLIGCKAELSKSFIQSVIIPDKMDLEPKWPLRVNDSLVIHIDIRGNSLTAASREDIWNGKLEEIGDLSYNQYAFHYENRVLERNPASIDLICDKDIDAAHPAGTSLADIAWLSALSPGKFIRSGYKDEFNWKDDTPEGYKHQLKYSGGYRPVFKLLSELTSEDMELLEPMMNIELSKPFLSPAEYTFTVTINFPDKTLTENTRITVSP